MPKETFLKLSKEKQHSFMSAAFSEFSRHDYNSASVSKIVKELGIAKGSIYQYFENKEELYKYLVDSASQKKIEWMTLDMGKLDDSTDFFKNLKVIILSGIRFDLLNPSISLLIMNALEEKQEFNNHNLSRELQQKSKKYLMDLHFQTAKEDNEEEKSYSELFYHVLNSSILNIGSFLETRYNFTTRSLLDQSTQELPFPMGELEEIVDDLIEIFRCGTS